MLKKLKQRQPKSDGFTIIEVMIVLAIAGLIMLIVFLAVPALQRNSRNTQRKTDAGVTASAVTTVLSNNNGSMTSITSGNVQAEVGTKLAYYTNTNISVIAGAAAASNTSTVDTIVIQTGAICSATGGTATATGANSRSVAVTYRVEPNVPQCTDL